MLDLPWTPFYTQSGGGAKPDGAEELSQLFYWSLAATVAFTLIVYSFEGNLDGRQKRAYQKTTFPQELETTVSKIDAEHASQKKDGDKQEDAKPLLEQLRAKFKNSQVYGLDKINFGMIASTYDTFESVTFLLLGFLPYAWDQSVHYGNSLFGLTAEDEIKISLIFLLLITIVGTITALPFEIYSTFQIERKHGFNKQTYTLFFTDKIKSLLLTFVIGGPFIALLLKIIQVSIDSLWYRFIEGVPFLE
jgi:STE24 endopeptidase